MTHAEYELFYWPSIQGRGEFVRLALEDAGASYVDVARVPDAEGGGVKAMMKLMKSAVGVAPFAPPFLRVGELVIAQTSNILFYLGPRLGLVPADEAHRLHANQLELTISDFVAEVHDTHHPIASNLYYEDQKPEAMRRSAAFVGERMLKFLGYFERQLEHGGGKHLIGGAHSYVDLSMFQVMAGLRYSLPKATKYFESKTPRLVALVNAIEARPRIAAYLASPRRLPFNENGIFRHYPELDGTPS